MLNHSQPPTEAEEASLLGTSIFSSSMLMGSTLGTISGLSLFTLPSSSGPSGSELLAVVGLAAGLGSVLGLLGGVVLYAVLHQGQFPTISLAPMTREWQRLKNVVARFAHVTQSSTAASA